MHRDSRGQRRGSTTDGLSHLAHVWHQDVVPGAKPTTRVDGLHPTVRCLCLDLCYRIMALGFKNQISRRITGQSDDKIGHVLVLLAVVQVRDCKA